MTSFAGLRFERWEFIAPKYVRNYRFLIIRLGPVTVEAGIFAMFAGDREIGLGVVIKTEFELPA